MISLATGSWIASVQRFRNEMQTVAPCNFKTQSQTNEDFFPSHGQPEGSFWFARLLTHLSFQSWHARLQRKALLLLVLLNINASFLPLSIQRDRGLTNALVFVASQVKQAAFRKLGGYSRA